MRLDGVPVDQQVTLSHFFMALGFPLGGSGNLGCATGQVTHAFHLRTVNYY
jgi:hypothetical protein